MTEPRRYKHPSVEASRRRALKAATPPEPPPPCQYDAHRDSDWTHPGGTKVLCGVCHPSPYEPAWSNWRALQAPRKESPCPVQAP